MRRIGASVAVVLLAGCAGTPPTRTHDAPPLFRTATVRTPVDPLWTHPEGPPEPGLLPPAGSREPPSGAARAGVSLDVRFETSDGQQVLAPRITAYDGHRSNVQVLTRTAYVKDFDVEKKDGAAVADPVIGLAREGAVLEMTARTSPGGRSVALAYALRTVRLRRPLDQEAITDLQGNTLTLQLPVSDRSEAAGVRSMEPGVWGLLARLPDGDGRTISVLARAEPVRLEFSTEDEEARDLGLVDPERGPRAPAKAVEPDEDSLPARAAKAPLPATPPGRLDIRTVTLPTDLPPGSVVEAGAAAPSLAAAELLEPGSLHLVTGLVPGARVACHRDETYVRDFDIRAEPAPATADPVPAVQVSGLAAEVGEEGALDISWTTTPRWRRFSFSPREDGPRLSLERPWSETHRARAFPGEGARLVVLARIADAKDGAPARALGVLVRFVPEPGTARR